MGYDHIRHKQMIRMIGLWMESYQPPADLVIEEFHLGGDIQVNSYRLKVTVRPSLSADDHSWLDACLRVLKQDLYELAFLIYLHKDVIITPVILDTEGEVII